MLVSAELRWFWHDTVPSGLEAWFRSGPFPPGGGRARRDEYLIDRSQTELGIKKRGGSGGVEVKGLVGTGRAAPEPFGRQVQLWAKWSSSVLSIDDRPQIVVAKTRWLRKFDTAGLNVRELALGEDEQLNDDAARLPERGCHLELVAIELPGGDGWWTLAFEAFGPLASVEDSFRRTAVCVAAPAPVLEGGLQLSYPEWLSRLPSHA